MSEKINVTKTYLPDLAEYTKLVTEIWESGQLTNNGDKCQELTERLKKHLAVKHLLLVSNGTIAIQLAIKALNLRGKIITTPFSYVATVSSIVWEGCEPTFVDIDPNSYCMDPSKIEASITEDTTAILATHVYGNPCDVDHIEKIAKKHSLSVIYDAAHAFGVQLNGSSILNHGDISTLSFHATKVFQTGEGGAIVTNNDDFAERLKFLGNFGHSSQETFQGLGINAKMSELHAAMGLCVLPSIKEIISNRRKAAERYDAALREVKGIRTVQIGGNISHNYSYYPVLFNNEETCIQVRDALNEKNIYPRRYFYPSLNKLPYVVPRSMPIAEDISKRILCLPLSAETSPTEVDQITSILIANL